MSNEENDEKQYDGDESILRQRMRECELALEDAKMELNRVNAMRYGVLARIEEINHDISFLSEHMNFSDMLEPYDFSKPVSYSDYGGGFIGNGEVQSDASETNSAGEQQND